jgi:hypothetical protein
MECLAAQPTAYLSQSGPLSIMVEKFAGAADAWVEFSLEALIALVLSAPGRQRTPSGRLDEFASQGRYSSSAATTGSPGLWRDEIASWEADLWQ